MPSLHSCSTNLAGWPTLTLLGLLGIRRRLPSLCRRLAVLLIVRLRRRLKHPLQRVVKAGFGIVRPFRSSFPRLSLWIAHVCVTRRRAGSRFNYSRPVDATGPVIRGCNLIEPPAAILARQLALPATGAFGAAVVAPSYQWGGQVCRASTLPKSSRSVQVRSAPPNLASVRHAHRA